MTDPRDMVGNNPTERVRRSSGRTRRKVRRRIERDLAGTPWAACCECDHQCACGDGCCYCGGCTL